MHISKLEGPPNTTDKGSSKRLLVPRVTARHLKFPHELDVVQHKKGQWALDDRNLERVKHVPEEGQNIYGLLVEGGRWNCQEAVHGHACDLRDSTVQFSPITTTSFVHIRQAT